MEKKYNLSYLSREIGVNQKDLINGLISMKIIRFFNDIRNYRFIGDSCYNDNFIVKEKRANNSGKLVYFFCFDEIGKNYLLESFYEGGDSNEN